MATAEIKIEGKESGLEFTIDYSLKRGEGKAVVFIPGLGCPKEEFEIAEDYFDANSRNNCLLTFGLPGVGGSRVTNGDFDYSTRTQADIVANLMVQLGISDAHIVGHSMGGVIGLILCENYPPLTRSFINVEGNILPGDSLASNRIVQAGEEGFEKEFDVIVSELSEAKYAGFREYARWMRKKADKRAYFEAAKRLQEATADGRIPGRLFQLASNLGNRMAYFLGGDTPTTAASAGLIKQCPFDVPIIPNATHFMMIDNPAVFYQKLVEYVTRFNKLNIW